MKNDFRIIECNVNEKYIKKLKKLKLCYCSWKRQFCNTIDKNKEKSISDWSQDDLMKIAFSGVKFINTLTDIRFENKVAGIESEQTLDEAQAMVDIMSILFTVLGSMKPKNIITTFPITKEYDGERYCSKDYYTTIEKFSEMDMDKPLGRDNVFKFLFDYQNNDLKWVYIEFIDAASDIYRSQTGKSFADKFCEDNGIDTYTFYDDGTLKNNTTGQVMKVKPKSNLRIVK